MIESFESFIEKLEKVCKAPSYSGTREKLLGSIDELALLIASNAHISPFLYMFPVGPIRFPEVHSSLECWIQIAQDAEGYIPEKYMRSLLKIRNVIADKPFDEMRLLVVQKYQNSCSASAHIYTLYEELFWETRKSIPVELLEAHRTLHKYYEYSQRDRPSL